MTTPLFVLIAASGQPALLRRTLQSLAECEKPIGYSGVVVAENGRPAGLDRVVAEFAPQHRFQYSYSPPPNKSLALNRALPALSGALVVFTDDDVQAPRGTLVAYANAAGQTRAGEFYGGPIVCDYETQPPPPAVKSLLPRSAGGWKLDAVAMTPISQPEFIGPNFAAFASDVLRVGGYDTRLGPGKHMFSPGEDTEIQERLLAHGVRGYYVPDAAMRHLVRADSATAEFAVHRAERNGIYWGISRARQRGFFPRQCLKIYGRWLNDRWRIARWRRGGDGTEALRASCLEAGWRGRWQGIRAGWNWDAQRRAAEDEIHFDAETPHRKAA